MADYRQIHTCIWKDSWFIELDADHKLLFIYLFSNERANLTGLYDLSLKVVAFETDLDRETIREGLGEFRLARKAYFSDGMMWVPNLLRHNARNITSPKIQAHIKTVISKTRECALKTQWIEYYNGIVSEEYRMDTLSIPMLESDRDHEQDQEHEQEQEQRHGAQASADAATPGNSPPLNEEKPKEQPPANRQEWIAAFDEHKNHPALIRRMHEILYPGRAPPDYGKIGSIANRMGTGPNGYTRLAGLLWDHNGRTIDGDILPYLLRVHQGKAKDNGSNHRGNTGERTEEETDAIADQITRKIEEINARTSSGVP